MGRLFWKFFFFIWLAQLTAVFGVSGAFWLRDRSQSSWQEMLDASPRAMTEVELAAKTLRYEGPEATRALLAHVSPSLRIVDDQGHELLNHPVTPQILQQARKELQAHPREAPVRHVESKGGAAYLIFQAHPEHRPPPPGPPLAGDAPPPHLGKDRNFFPVIPLITALIASLVFAALLAWYVAKPIRNLHAAFNAAAQGNLALRIAPTMGRRRDELADLGHDFDLMADRLQLLMDSQRRLLHDVSHEMRSPLARLQVAIGLARQRPEKFEETMNRLERESERMDRLVGELLTLSRLDVGMARAAPETVSVKQLVEEVVENAHFEAEAAGKQVRLEAQDDAIIVGQPELLQRALENVVRNAIRHTPPDSSVTLTMRIDDKTHQLSIAVQDNGSGVDESELETIFEPFKRGSKSIGTDGHGLGLAIAQRVIKAHHGQIQAHNRPEGGFCVEIILPVPPSR